MAFLGDCVTLIIIADITMTFFTSYKDENGILVDDVGKIARRYVTSWLATDLLVILPLNWVLINFGIMEKGKYKFGQVNK